MTEAAGITLSNVVLNLGRGHFKSYRNGRVKSTQQEGQVTYA